MLVRLESVVYDHQTYWLCCIMIPSFRKFTVKSKGAARPSSGARTLKSSHSGLVLSLVKTPWEATLLLYTAWSDGTINNVQNSCFKHIDGRTLLLSAVTVYTFNSLVVLSLAN